MNIYRDEETTGLHAGWGITGEDEGDVGSVAATDVANQPVEESLDVPDTTDGLPESTGEDVSGIDPDAEDAVQITDDGSGQTDGQTDDGAGQADDGSGQTDGQTDDGSGQTDGQTDDGAGQ